MNNRVDHAKLSYLHIPILESRQIMRNIDIVSITRYNIRYETGDESTISIPANQSTVSRRLKSSGNNAKVHWENAFLHYCRPGTEVVICSLKKASEKHPGELMHKCIASWDDEKFHERERLLNIMIQIGTLLAEYRGKS